MTGLVTDISIFIITDGVVDNMRQTGPKHLIFSSSLAQLRENFS